MRPVGHSIPRGIWLVTLAVVAGCAATSSDLAPRTRTYFIAADTVDWDYDAGGQDEITGKPFVDSVFFKSGKGEPISSKYHKTLYREYADSTFKTLKARPPEWEHLGFLGPVIRGVVGDTIKVVFRNDGTHPYSVHPHGVFYHKDSEGAPYEDGTKDADKADDAVPIGATHIYTWLVPERAGPGPMDPSSVIWMYHSHTDEIKDVNSGLFGPMIITARGKARPDGSPVDVDRELITSFMQVHEENSWDAERNIKIPPKQQADIIPSPRVPQQIYPPFVTFSINGFSRGTLPLRSVTVKKGEHVRWYLLASTNDFDAHAPHWHGNTVLLNQMRTDVAELAPMGMLIADMVPDNVGTWLYHCHISFHMASGMQARYAVVP